MSTDRVTNVIHAYFAAVDERDTETLADLLADEALIATPLGDDEVAERHLRSGVQLRHGLESRAPVPWRHRILNVHASGQIALVEGSLVQDGDATPSGFLAIVEVSGAGRVVSLRSFRRSSPDAELPVATRRQWLELLDGVVNDRLGAACAYDALLMAVPSQPLPAIAPLSLQLSVTGRHTAALIGRAGEAAEFCLVARREPSHAWSHVAGSWCWLSQEDPGKSDGEFGNGC